VNVAALVRNRWMMTVRGGLAVVFGLAIVLWPRATLSSVVGLFGLYAVLDGAWTIAAGVRVSGRSLGAWPVLLEGVVSVGLGALTLGWPLLPHQVVHVLAAWGLVTGGLEVLAAFTLPRRGASYWLLVTAGVSSLFLATLLLLVPHADVDLIARIIAAYAQVFGIVLIFAAIRFPRDFAATGYAGSV
jgi:uncharacterized membrane protein HdeD (DUF308 family)